MTFRRFVPFLVSATLLLPPVRGTAEGITVDESTGLVGYRYQFDLAPARGRYQPALTLLAKVPGFVTAPQIGGCTNSNYGYGAGWALDLPSITYDGTDHWFNKPHRGARLLESNRDVVGMVADVEAEYRKFNASIDSPTTTIMAVDAAGNKLTFKTPNSSNRSQPFVLIEAVDPDGNVTTYTWEREGLGSRLQRIEYNAFSTVPAERGATGSVGASGNWGASVEVNWGTVNGGAVPTSIDVKVRTVAGTIDPGTGLMVPQEAVSARRYELAFAASGSVNDTSLVSIAQVGNSGGTVRLATTFERSTSNGCLQAVVTPLGARQEVAYLRSTDFGDPVSAGYPVVKSITTSGPAMDTNTVNYWYASPQRRAAGDYRGFAESWSQDAVSGLVLHSTWDVASSAFMGWPLRLETGTQRLAGTALSPPALDVIRRLTYVHAARSMNSSACTISPAEIPQSAYPVIPFNSSEEDVRFVDGVTLGTRTTTTCGLIDRWGNVQQFQVDPDINISNNELTVNTTYLATVDPSMPCKDCVVTRATTLGAGLLENTLLGYDATSRLTSIQRQAKAGETSSAYPTVTSLSYFGNGNLASKSEGGATYVYTYDDYFQARVAKVEASDPLLLTKHLVTETAFDATGRPVRIIGPYYEALGSGREGEVAVPASARPERHLGYDELGRLVAIAKRPLSALSVSEGLAAFRYQPYQASSPASVTAYQFAVPKPFQLGAPPETEDVRQVTNFLDGLGRTVQMRERLGGAVGEPAAAIVQHLNKYRVSEAVRIDGAGRVTAVLAPYYSSSSGYRDLAAASFTPGGSEVVRGPVQVTWYAYDLQGRQICSTLRALTTTLAASAPAAGACASSFAEDAGYARAARTVYRGLTDPADGRRLLGVKSIDPRFTVPGGLAMGTEVFIDAAGLLRRTTDAEGNGVRYQYDALGRATATVREAPGSVRGTITSSVTLDMMGRVAARTDPNLGNRSFTYDVMAPGLLSAVRFTKTGEEIRYRYDLGRAKLVEFCSAGGSCTTDSDLTWDLPYQKEKPNENPYANTAGRVGAASNARTTLAFSYDDAGAMVRRDQWVGGTTFSFTAARRADGVMTQSNFIPSGGGLPVLTVNTGFDSAGRPVQVQAGSSTLWSAPAGADGTGAYTAFGQLGAAQLDDGLVRQSWTRGAASGLLTAQSVTIPSAANPVVYNVTGMTYRGLMLQGYTDTVSQTAHQFWYSNAGRLVAARSRDSATSAQKQLTCMGFATDDKYGPGPSFGNIEVAKEGSATLVTKNYSYSGGGIDLGPAGPDAPTSAGTVGVTYDTFGRVATKSGGAEVFAYDLAGRLVGATRTSGQSETLGYDPFGMLVTRTVNGQATWYLGHQATVTRVAGVLRADVHVVVNGERVASVRVGSSPRTQYLHRDRLTSVVATTLAGGVKGATYRYTPYGAAEATTGDAGDAASELGYAGALRLTGGLLSMGARAYDPGLKIFLQPDPLAPHTYTYADGDPINRWDPAGLESRPADGGQPRKCIGKDDCRTPHEGQPDEPSPGQEGSEENPVVIDDGGVVRLPPKSGLAPGDIARNFGGPRFYVDLYQSMPRQYHVLTAARGGKEYLIDYGYRYALMFSELAENTDSLNVKAAIRKISIELQAAILELLNEQPNLSLNPELLGEAAFLSHGGAYGAGGFGQLTIREQFDLLNVVGLSDLNDFGTWTGIRAAGGVMLLINLPAPGLVPYP